MGFINLTLKSRNQKVGKVPVSTSGKQTCPDTCPLKESGACYADGGPLSVFWDKVTKEEAQLRKTIYLESESLIFFLFFEFNHLS